MEKEKSWKNELTEMWAAEIASGDMNIEDLLGNWPTKEIYEEETRSYERWALERRIQAHFFDEEEFEKTILRFNQRQSEARRKVYKILSNIDKKICNELLAEYEPYTTSQKKIFRFYRQLFKHKSFKTEVEKIRSMIGIPKSGITLNEENKEKFLADDFIKKFEEEVLDLAKKFEMGSGGRYALVRQILFDKVSVSEMILHDLCKLEVTSDLIRSNISPFRDIDLYPITILVSPYAEIQDIVNFITARKNQIKDLQKPNRKEGVSIGSYNTRVTTRKYDFIWKHQAVRPARRLAEMVNKKFGTQHDAIYIRNIVSRENRLRGKA